ncbi:MAG: NAD-dependent DNA ligase LigA [Polyangiaceae bacterium]|nr:NAD-dependent DNA ligase LigA [Polyangiaceae bacterium]
MSTLDDCIDAAVAFHAAMAAKRDALPYEIDGVVLKVNDRTTHARLGVRSRSPRYAFAFKFPPREEVTKVLDIVVQVGRTGKLTPVAQLQPVDVSGVTVSRATLHNQDEIERKDVRVGDTVRVRRAGDVIPEVVEVLKDQRPKGTKAFTMPDACPVCEARVVREGAYHLCTNGLSCPAQLERHLSHFTSRGAMDIVGLGDKTVKQLLEKGLIKDLADIYLVTPIDLVGLEGFAEKSIENLSAAIEASKKPRLERFLFALGIEHVGITVAGLLADHFGALSGIMDASEEDLQEIRGIGPEVAEDVGPDRLRRFLEPLPSTPAPPPPPEPLALAPGAEVFVGHRGAYHRAIVVAAGTDGMIRVRYAAPSDGVAEESVPSSRVRPAPSPSSPPFQPDQKVFVEWHGMFFPGRILRASGKGMYRVRFDGVGSDADEDVPVRRLRAAP